MCSFSTLIFEKLDFKVQTSFSLFSLSNFRSPLSFSLHSSSPTFKLLSMASYGGEHVLDSSSPWSGVSNHFSSFSIPLPLIFKKQRTPLMKKIQGLQALHEAILHWLHHFCDFFIKMLLLCWTSHVLRCMTCKSRLWL